MWGVLFFWRKPCPFGEACFHACPTPATLCHSKVFETTDCCFASEWLQRKTELGSKLSQFHWEWRSPQSLPWCHWRPWQHWRRSSWRPAQSCHKLPPQSWSGWTADHLPLFVLTKKVFFNIRFLGENPSFWFDWMLCALNILSMLAGHSN